MGAEEKSPWPCRSCRTPWAGHLWGAAVLHIGVTVTNRRGNCGLLNVSVVWVCSTLTWILLKCQIVHFMNPICSELSLFLWLQIFHSTWDWVPTYFNKILADLWCLLTSDLSAAVVTLILVLLSQTLWLCRTKQPGSEFCDGFFSLSPLLLWEDSK